MNKLSLTHTLYESDGCPGLMAPPLPVEGQLERLLPGENTNTNTITNTITNTNTNTTRLLSAFLYWIKQRKKGSSADAGVFVWEDNQLFCWTSLMAR